MGKVTGHDGSRLALSLVGNFRLRDPDGRDIRIREKKARALLAMLATARDRRRSRDWLKSRLWERSFEEQASNSLRQCLHVLRKVLYPYSDVLQADYDHVWLERVDVEIDPAGDPRAEFFEDAPRLGEAGEDWLREERQAFAARQEDAPRAMVDVGRAVSVQPVTFEAPPCLLIGNPVVVAEDMRAAVVAERVTTMMQETFRANGFVQTYDLRDVQSNQLAGRSQESLARPPILAEVRVSVLGRELQATIVARVPATGKVIWTASIASDTDAAFSIASETMMEFVMGAVDSIEGLVLRQPGHGVKPTLYTAVHQLFALSREGLHEAVHHLEAFTAPSEYSANAEGWLAFGTMLMRNEIRERREATVAVAGEHLARALEAEPSNPVVLAIAGHYEGFIRSDLALGRQYLADSRKILPNLAFAWDATAMNAIYSGDLDRGAQAADIARRLGRYSPYRFYYDASAVIAATLQGRHEDAIRVGERVLAKRPKFLPVLRHLFASYAALGRREDAMRTFHEIRDVEPSFGTPAMREEDYARTYAKTIAMIEAGLNEMGLIGRS